MRLLVLTDRYPPYHTGGDETSCHSVVEGLKSHGHEVFVLTSKFGVGKPVVEGKVYRLLNRPYDTSSLLKQSKWELEDNQTFRKLLNRLQPDLIASWCIFSLFPSLHLAMKESKLPVVYNMQNIWIDRQLENEAQRLEIWRRPGSGPLNRTLKPLVKKLVQLLNPNCLRAIGSTDIDLRYVVQCSQASRKAHQDAGFEEKDWAVIYNGIDVSRFHSNRTSKQSDALAILFAGRLVDSKGPHTLIDAVAELKRRGYTQIRLSIAGQQGYPKEYGDSLHRLVEQEGLAQQVKFLGAVSYAEMPLLFHKHQVLVFPSIAPEGFPMTLIEAMACGLTVVGTTTGGSAEILSNNVNSLTFTPEDVSELADCLERLIEDSNLLAELGHNGQQWVRKHCESHLVMHQWEQYLNFVVENFNS